MVFVGDVVSGTGQNYSLCLVGRFLTKKSIRVHIMKECMAEIWSPF